jgi:hypothetical protein
MAMNATQNGNGLLAHSDGSNVVARSEKIGAFATALVKAQTAARSVEKDSSNSFHRYKYASAEAIIDEARSALVAAGIACLSTGWNFVPTAAEHVRPREGKEGKPAPVVVGRVFVQYMVLHESGEWMQFEASTPVIPESGRPEDKAEATALTYNAGYFLRGLLMLPRVEEGSQVDDRHDRPQPASKAANGNGYGSPPPAAPPPDVEQPRARFIEVGKTGTMADYRKLCIEVSKMSDAAKLELSAPAKEARASIEAREKAAKEADAAFAGEGRQAGED